jgi:hypothetical protein
MIRNNPRMATPFSKPPAEQQQKEQRIQESYKNKVCLHTIKN